uniref:Uncharacterized protein n=1 Tax=Lepeophtheirus salmonis TaxID=72036 RepID=A0A0K2T7U1_LEPSM
MMDYSYSTILLDSRTSICIILSKSSDFYLVMIQNVSKKR